MRRDICKMNVELYDTGETICFGGSIQFNGGGDDVIALMAHLFLSALELTPSQLMISCLGAIELHNAQKEEGGHG